MRDQTVGRDGSLVHPQSGWDDHESIWQSCADVRTRAAVGFQRTERETAMTMVEERSGVDTPEQAQ